MPESPDFDAIARRIIGLGGPTSPQSYAERDIAEQLRLVWNARGAADLVKIENVTEHAIELIRGEWGEDSSALELAEALNALRSLDR